MVSADTAHTRTKPGTPVVLAAQIILGLQTIVSREVQPGEPAVVTVGSIHGGTKHNIIPDEVAPIDRPFLHDEVRRQTIEAIKRIVRGQAIAAGVPEAPFARSQSRGRIYPATYNNPELTDKIVAVFKNWLGDSNVFKKKPSMGGKTFPNMAAPRIKSPSACFSSAASNRNLERKRAHRQPLPSLHSPLWAPLPEPTYKPA